MNMLPLNRRLNLINETINPKKMLIVITDDSTLVLLTQQPVTLVLHPQKSSLLSLERKKNNP